MKRFLLVVMLLTAGMAMNAQGMAKEEGESIAAHLKLSPQQKQAVIKLYSAEEAKTKQKREKAREGKKPSSATLSGREKAAAAKAGTHKSNPKVNHSKSKPSISSSERLLLVAYGKAKANPSIQQGMKDILTPAQFTEWNKIGNK